MNADLQMLYFITEELISGNKFWIYKLFFQYLVPALTVNEK